MRLARDSPLLAKCRNWLDSLSPDDKVLIIHDNDPDGLCSAVLFAGLLKTFTTDTPLFRAGHRDFLLNDEVRSVLGQNSITHIVTVDLQTELHRDQVLEVSKDRKILIIDHHAMAEPIDDPNVQIVKPQLADHTINAARYSTSLLVYDIAPGLLTELDWVMAMGLIADFGYYENPQVVHEVYERHGWPRPQSDIAVYDAFSGLCAKLLNNALLISYDHAHQALLELLDADSIEEFLNKQVCSLGQSIEQYIVACVLRHNKDAEWFEDVLWYDIQSPFNLKKPVSTRLGQKYWHKTIFCVTTFDDGKAKFSVRRNCGAVPLNDILSTAAKQFGGHAGGHPVATGGFVPSEKLESFKNAIIPLLNEHTCNESCAKDKQ